MNGLPAALNCFCARASLARTGALMAAACTFDTTHDEWADGGRVPPNGSIGRLPHLPSSAGDAAAANAIEQKRIDMHSATQITEFLISNLASHARETDIDMATRVPRASITFALPDLTDTVTDLCPDTCATWRPPSDTIIWRWGQTHGHMASHKYEIASLHVHTMRPRSTPLAAAASLPRSSRLASDLGAISVRPRCDLGALSVRSRCDLGAASVRRSTSSRRA